MPERIGHLNISLSRGDLTVTWPARQQLMARLMHVRTRARIRDSFQAAGSTHVAELKAGQRATLLAVLDEWALDGSGGDGMPQELMLLQAALAQELRRAGTPGAPSPTA